MRTSLDRRAAHLLLRSNCFALLTALLAGMPIPVLATDLDPVFKGQWPGYVRADFSAVAVSGQYAYAVGTFGGLHVLDLSSPANPQWVGACYQATGGHIAVSGKYACTTEPPFRVIDLSDPGHPRVVGSLWGVAGLVAVAGTYAYVVEDSGRFRVLDVSNPAQPRPAGSLELARSGSGYGSFGDSRMSALGEYVYVATGAAGLEVIDVGVPAQPRRVASNTGFEAWSVVTQGDRLYVAAGIDGLAILDAY